MNEKEYREYISTQDNEEIAKVLQDKTVLYDVRKMYQDEAVKRFVNWTDERKIVMTRLEEWRENFKEENMQHITFTSKDISNILQSFLDLWVGN